MAEDRALSFYFDYLSPYAYLAWTRIGPLAARRGLRLEPRPVLFAGLLKHWAHRGPAEIPPKRTFIFKDALRTAALWGVPMACPRMHPFNPLAALRLSLAEVAGPEQVRAIDALFRAGWGEGIDLGDEGDLQRALERAGLDGAALLARSRGPAAKDALRRETEAALAAGVFGVPTMIVGGELFWGADRLAHLELYLEGKDPLDRARAAEVLARPRGADRREVKT